MSDTKSQKVPLGRVATHQIPKHPDDVIDKKTVFASHRGEVVIVRIFSNEKSPSIVVARKNMNLRKQRMQNAYLRINNKLGGQ